MTIIINELPSDN